MSRTPGLTDSVHQPSGQWLLLFRTAISLVLLIGGGVLHLRAGVPLRPLPTFLFYGSLGGAFIFSLGVATALRARKRFVDHGVLGDLQLLADVAVTTTLVYATGGQDSVLTFLYPLNTLYAAALVSRPAGYAIAATGASSFVALVAMQATGLLPRIDEPGAPFDREAMAVVTAAAGANFLVAMLGGQLSEQLRTSGETLRQARLDLRALRELQSAMVQSLGSGLISVNAEGRIQLINPAAARILGVDEQGAMWRLLSEVLPNLDVRRAAASSHLPELRYEHPDGAVRQISVSASMLPSNAVTGAGAVVVLQDVTEQRRLEQAMMLSRRLATVGQFAAGLAHELRNPLGSMIGCVELLKQSASAGGDDDRLLSIIHREAERLARLVQDFLQFARPQPPQRGRVGVLELMREIAEDCDRDPQMHTKVRLQCDDGLAVHADAAQLRQVLWNLVRNAAQHSPPGEDIVISAEKDLMLDEPRVRISVVDRGPGVVPEVEKRLFEPFFTTRSQGTGLGLAIVHRIVEAHGGVAGLAGTDGPGATFYVLLPAHTGTSTQTAAAVQQDEPEPAHRG